MTKTKQRELTISEFARMGAKAQRRKYGRKQLREWAKLGGRPKKILYGAQSLTIEKRIVVGVADIKAVSLACARCAAKVSFSPDKPIKIPRVCPQCAAAWASDIKPSHQLVESAASSFLESLFALRTVMNSEAFMILLEFEERGLPPSER